MWICDIITSPAHGCIYVVWLPKGSPASGIACLAACQGSGFVRMVVAKTAFGASLFTG